MKKEGKAFQIEDTAHAKKRDTKQLRKFREHRWIPMAER